MCVRALPQNEIKEKDENCVVMGALTKCSCGKTVGVQLRTVDIGIEDSHGFKMMDTDTDKNVNFVDAGIKMVLAGKEAGTVKDNQKPTVWYGVCTARGNELCSPRFLPEWFEPDEAVTYAPSFFNEYKKYIAAMKSANDATKQAIKDFESFQQSKKAELSFLDKIPFINLFNGGNDKIKQNDAIDKTVTDSKLVALSIDPALASRSDGASDIKAVNKTLDDLAKLDPSYAQSESYMAAKKQIENAERSISKLDTSAQNGKKHPLLIRSKLICTYGPGVVSITDNGQKTSMLKNEWLDEEYLAYGGNNVVNNSDEGFFRVYDTPTLPSTKEKYNLGQLYNEYNQSPTNALQGFGGTGSRLNTSGNATTYGGQILDNKKGTLIYNGIERYCIALGPKLQNPNCDLNNIVPTDMAYGTCVDIEIPIDGKLYYIPAIIVDVKYHTAPDGVFQTNKAFGSSDAENYDGNIVEWYTVQKDGDKNKSSGLNQYSQSASIIFYRDEVLN